MENSTAYEPLISNREEAGEAIVLLNSHGGSSFGPSFVDEGDIEPINRVGDFFREFSVESKKLWLLAGPAVFTSICQYSLGAVTQVFAGQVGTLELAAFSVENSVIAGFSFGIMMGMGSALETLCGQAYGAGQHDMLGIYMQRSWVILNATSIILMFLYLFAEPLLKLIGQDAKIAEAAGVFAVYMIPQLFAYSMNFPIAKFLQAQSKIMVMAMISLVVLILHTILSWVVMLKLGWGLVGAAVVLNASWWLIVVGQLLYIFGGTCGRAWSGFSWKAFQNLWGFVRLSLASAVMLWYNYLSLAINHRGFFKVSISTIMLIALWYSRSGLSTQNQLAMSGVVFNIYSRSMHREWSMWDYYLHYAPPRVGLFESSTSWTVVWLPLPSWVLLGSYVSYKA